MQIRYLGQIPYNLALDIMTKTHAEVLASAGRFEDNVLLVLSHPPTVTLGNRPLKEHLITPLEKLKFLGIEYFSVDRGGSATVHEPGQIVIYPIVKFNSQQMTVKRFVCALEEAMIRLCAKFDIKSQRDEINPGIWVGMNKIGAIGIRVQDKVSKHGIAFNALNNLQTFQHIIPCGLSGRGVTSLKNELVKKDKLGQDLLLNLHFDDLEKMLAELVYKELQFIC